MAQAQPLMSGPAESIKSTELTALDEIVAGLRDKAQEFARLPAIAKAALLRECIPRLVDLGDDWVARGSRAKGLTPDQVGEEWLAGVMPTVRMCRLLAESLEQIHKSGRPQFGRKSRTGHGNRLEVELFPGSAIDAALFGGFVGHVVMEDDLDRDAAIARQASFYQQSDPEGGVSLVLGAGNVSSIGPMDAFTKMFTEGFVCVLKMNPVNEWVGPCLERGLAPLIRRGYLQIVYGGTDVGKHLVTHPGVDDVHITGAEATHEIIVWGPPGAERERRKKAGDRILTKPISSELGNVSPVVIVPYAYSEAELRFQARNVGTMIGNNGSFNCNAAKLLVTSAGWPQRERFLDMIESFMETLPTRRAYYPGAADRYDALTSGRDGLREIGRRTDTNLPWAMIRGIDSSVEDEPLFSVEPFCSMISETTVGSADPVEFLTTVTDFLNNRVWGTLNACLIVHPKLEADRVVGAAVAGAIAGLRYGTVAINHWPAVCYGTTTMPWGGHPSATLDNIQSGLGWVHNTFMLEGIEKSVIRGPIKMWPEPLWFVDNPRSATLGPRLVDLEMSPGWLKVPGIALRALL